MIPLLTVTFLAMPAFAPATMTSLSGAGVAATTVKSIKSNISDCKLNCRSNRTKKTQNSVTTPKAP
jgi:hypothetical protein